MSLSNLSSFNDQHLASTNGIVNDRVWYSVNSMTMKMIMMAA